MVFRVFAIAALLVLGCGAVQAQDAAACGKFKWSLARELAWIAAGPAHVASGAAIAIADKAYVITLAPNAAAGYVLPPEREPKAGTNGATLQVAPPSAAGLYEFTLSDEAWIDVIQGGVRLKSVDFSGQKDCAGVRKSVRFALSAAPLTLEISNVEGETITMAIAAAN